jgi:hypothetical protein
VSTAQTVQYLLMIAALAVFLLRPIHAPIFRVDLYGYLTGLLVGTSIGIGARKVFSL